MCLKFQGVSHWSRRDVIWVICLARQYTGVFLKVDIILQSTNYLYELCTGITNLTAHLIEAEEKLFRLLVQQGSLHSHQLPYQFQLD